MGRWIIPLVLLALAQIACIPPQDCMGITATITGLIVDVSGHPVADATVTVYGKSTDYISFPESVTVQTNVDGEFTVDGVFTYECADFYIDVTADGYEPISDTGPYVIWTTFGELQQDIIIPLTEEG